VIVWVDVWAWQILPLTRLRFAGTIVPSRNTHYAPRGFIKMIHSMTGFASVEVQTPGGRLTWEMRSVNHRYLEISLRLPEDFRVLEPAIRDHLGEQLSRGKIDASLRFSRAKDSGDNELVLNEELAQHLLELHQELQRLSNNEQAANLNDLLRWPGMVSERPPESEPLQQAATSLLNEAAAELKASRNREGEKLAAIIVERLDGVSQIVAQVRNWLPDIREALKLKLINRVADLPQPLDPGRLEQEVAFLVQKIDVDEELDRLDAHTSEARRVLELDEPVGRRLDFLMQEFNRESNTLSSKSVDQRTTQASVDLKVLIEQMREQVQNIE
jgi:uncharacterized protein (TIGR00255 family)